MDENAIPSSEIRFIHPVSDIDSWIILEDKGMSMMLDKVQKMEMSIRRKQLAAEEYGQDEYEDNEFVDMVEEHSKLTEELEQKNAATHRTDVAFRPLRPNIQRQLEEDMKYSIVLNDAGSDYNKTDEELFGDKEKQEIMQKLGRIRNIYYDPISYRAAILTIKEAIEYSLKHDYPWLGSYIEAVKQFNAGKIKYMGHIPKLYLGFGTNQVTDPQILAGIVSGDVTIIDRDDEEKKLRNTRNRVPYEPVQMDYSVIRSKEYQEYSRLHNMGIDTPISVVLKSKSQLFDRLSMPFSFVSQQTEKPVKEEDLIFDWTQPNAGEVFFAQENGINRHSLSNLISMINKENNNELNRNLQSGLQEFLYALSHPTQQSIDCYVNSVKLPEPSEQALALEQSILSAIRQNNPNL